MVRRYFGHLPRKISRFVFHIIEMSFMVELEGIVVDIKVLVYYTKWGARDKAQGVLQAF